MLDLDDVLQVGKSLRIHYNKNNPNNRLIHIRAIVDDEYIVYRFWGKRRGGWYYGVEHKYMFHAKNVGGALFLPRQKVKDCLF